MNKKIVSKSSEDTKKIGLIIGENAFLGMNVLLSGDLGAGKTCLTSGIGVGLGVSRKINSPTFTILKIYQGRMPLYHVDAYRLENHFQDIGFDDIVDSDGVCVIEWFDFVSPILPKEYLMIKINYIDNDNRELVITSNGDKYDQLMEKFV